ncbi:MAG: SPOR domain-containing protein [Treponema sp.]|jgi:hypothetical protein|nr:SPOR domain-containing protein [Treponema sp.]
MKKIPVFIGLLCAVLGVLSAQNFIPAQYEEISLSAFRDWRMANSGEEKKFKIPALFNSTDGTMFRFTGSGQEDRLEFETEFPWPRMQSGQAVTLYVTAAGPWVWDRQLDAVDYGNNRLVQADGSSTGTPAASPLPAVSSGETAPVPAEGGFDYGQAPRIEPRQVVVQVLGNPPREDRYYRLQVGSFVVRGNATRAANSLKEAGLDPAFEQYRDNVRVVVSRIAGKDVIETARKIGGAGFTKIWCREEP